MAFSRMGRALSPALAAALLAVPPAGCVRAPDDAVPAPGASAAASAAANDLAGLLATLKRAHPDPWHGVDEATFTAALRELSQRAPALGHGEPLTLRWMDASRTAYLRYREVRGDTSRVAALLTELVATRGVARVVVDLRWNPGGNNRTYPPLLEALLAPGVDRRGRLFVLTSRITFSAATNFATELDLRSSAVFVGEATGGSPNLYGDTTNYRMPSLGLTVRVPTI